MIRGNVVLAVASRNFRSYFSGILGYLFIIVFCVASAFFAFNAEFFTANQANLDQLSTQFPILLLFLIPAITMTTWSDERKLGTDELLFTLPAQELEILLGKYLAVAGVYSVAVVFSMINAAILSFLGKPDWGLLSSSYFGYWISGCALLSVGMLASALTNSATVAFVLGVVFCCVPVFVGNVADLLDWLMTIGGRTGGGFYEVRSALQSLSLQEQLRDFSIGVLPFSSLFYFVALTALMLYLNLIVISKRRWAETEQAGMGLQFGVRTLCLFVTFVSVLVMLNLFPARADLTAEKLFTLSSATTGALSGIPDGQLITVQAFVSPDVPREYSDTRRRLLGLLREFDLRGGGKLDVRVVNVEPFSEQAEEARALGINPTSIQYEQNGKFEEAEVFMGAMISSTTDRVAVPFFGKGLPIEYELTRSVRTVAQEKRLVVGVLQTDASVVADSPGSDREWEIIRELRKQYKVISVNPSRKILAEKPAANDSKDDAKKDDADSTGEKDKGEDFDVLLAIMPSSLTDIQMQNLVEYVQAGKPTLIFDDPCPLNLRTQGGLTTAPKLPKPSPGGGMGGMFGGGQQAEPKADNGEARTLMSLLDVSWDNGQVVYDRSKPHGQFESLPDEYVFVSKHGNQKAAFNPESPVTRDLNDIVAIYSGTIQDRDRKADQEFIPLLQTSGVSGLIKWEDYTEQSFSPFSMSPAVQLVPNPPQRDDKFAHVIAAHIRNKTSESPLNVIFCSDIDMITDWFFFERNRGNLDIEFDNVTFVLNSVDTLAGEDNFIQLRSRRSTLRTLSYVENQTRDFREKLGREESDAEQMMKDKLDAARKELQAQVDEISKRTDVDEEGKERLMRQRQEELQRKLDIEEKELEREKNSRIRKAGLEMKRHVRSVENFVRSIAWVVPAVLPACFGMLFLGMRNLAEQQSISPNRRRN